jgi:hypothetical protein
MAIRQRGRQAADDETVRLTPEQRRQIERLAPHVDQITSTDLDFFKRHPDRRHRVRLSSEAEIAEIEVAANKLLQPPAGLRWFTIVRKVPGARLRIFVISREDAETGVDVPEDLADALFDTASPQGLREIDARLSAALSKEGARA